MQMIAAKANKLVASSTQIQETINKELPSSFTSLMRHPYRTSYDQLVIYRLFGCTFQTSNNLKESTQQIVK